MGALSRRKGHSWERELCRRLRDLYGADVRRSIQSRNGGAEGCDVEGTPWCIEAKVGARPNLRGALLQAEEDAAEREDTRPCVAVAKWTSSGGKPPDELVVMRWETWFALISGELP